MPLTPREKQVLELFAAGRSHEEIAGLIFDPTSIVKGRLPRKHRLEQIMAQAVRKAKFYSDYFEAHCECRKGTAAQLLDMSEAGSGLSDDPS